MRVILRENIENLGKKGDIVKVAPGYGRNFLVPKKMAIEVTPTNAKMIAIEQAALQKGLEQEMSTYNELIQQLSQISLSFVRKTSEKDVIFGSVSSSDIRDALEDLGFNIEKKKIILDEPIKRLGNFTVPVKVFHEERAEIKIEVVKEGAPTEEPKTEEVQAVKEEIEAVPIASEEPAPASIEEAAPEEEKEIEAIPEEIPIESQEAETEVESKDDAAEIGAVSEEPPAESQEKEVEIEVEPEESPAESKEPEQEEMTIDDAEKEESDRDLTEETIAEEAPVPEEEKPPAPVDEKTGDESPEETEAQEEPSDKKKEEDKDKGV